MSLQDNVCPICDLVFTSGSLNVHVTTKYDETVFGSFVADDPSVSFNFTEVGKWLTRILGPGSYLCLSEMDNSDVLIRGRTIIDGSVFEWRRVSSPVVLLQILKSENLYPILLDPKLLE